MDKQLVNVTEHPMDYLKWIVAFVGGFIGAIPELVWLLVGLMAFDLVFAFAAGYRNANVDSDRLWKTVSKNVNALLALSLIAFLDIYVDLAGIDLVQATTIFYIGPLLVRIMESMTLSGVPLPPQLTQILAIFRPPESKEVK
jgi:toxin secretion/phage lysis holin